MRDLKKYIEEAKRKFPESSRGFRILDDMERDIPELVKPEIAKIHKFAKQMEKEQKFVIDNFDNQQTNYEIGVLTGIKRINGLIERQI